MAPVARAIYQPLLEEYLEWMQSYRHAAPLTLRARADAVILWLTREDEGLAWHVPVMRQALAAANLPALVLPAASWRADDGVPGRIEDFCREVGR